jgi:prepilin-type N-terminal cleavage/methylation domain-containing protein
MIPQAQGTETERKIANDGKRIEPLNPLSEIRIPKSFRSPRSRSSLLVPRPSFTLVELLVAILIIGILASALLGVAAVAGESAREAKTRNLIARIHTLLMEQYDTYKSRRVKVRQKVLDAIDDPVNNNVSAAVRGSEHQQARLYALREMMLMEMPCRWSEVLLNAVPTSPTGFPDALIPVYLDPLGGASASGTGAANFRTPLAALYLRQYARMVGATNKLTNKPNTDADIKNNEGAECLYMVVINACGDGEAKSLFSESSIGDTDGDGAPEFLDGWGHPISFLRWAPGFASDIEPNANELPDTNSTPPTGIGTNAAWEETAKLDHDPFDLFRIDIAAFRLIPLVISSGRDETFGIRMNTSNYWQGISNTNNPFNLTGAPILSPYAKVNDPADSMSVYLGSIDTKDTTSATDNIHNHLIGTR